MGQVCPRTNGEHEVSVNSEQIPKRERSDVVPEFGVWTRTSEEIDGAPIWVMRGDHLVVDLGLTAAETAWERLRKLEHPAIPCALALDKDEQILRVLAPVGVPLSRLLEHRHDPSFVVTPGTLLDLGVQLAEALVHAHENGRPHGHLNPDQIWITPDGELVIWGYGEGPASPSVPRWGPPETSAGGRASGDADQWALAAVLGALVTGRFPWKSTSPQEGEDRNCPHLWEPVMTQWKPLGRLIQRGLAADPAGRFPSVHPMRGALVALRQRVNQPSSLGEMAAKLLETYGQPPIEEVEPPSAAKSLPVDYDESVHEDFVDESDMPTAIPVARVVPEGSLAQPEAFDDPPSFARAEPVSLAPPVAPAVGGLPSSEGMSWDGPAPIAQESSEDGTSVPQGPALALGTPATRVGGEPSLGLGEQNAQSSAPAPQSTFSSEEEDDRDPLDTWSALGLDVPGVTLPKITMALLGLTLVLLVGLLLFGR